MSGSTATREHGSSEPEWEHFRNSRLPFSRNAPFSKRKSRKPQRVDCSSTEDDASRPDQGRHAIQVRIVELPEPRVLDRQLGFHQRVARRKIAIQRDQFQGFTARGGRNA